MVDDPNFKKLRSLNEPTLSNKISFLNQINPFEILQSQHSLCWYQKKILYSRTYVSDTL